jgi:hypothetical protein
MESSGKLQSIAGKKTAIFSFSVWKLDIFYSDFSVILIYIYALSSSTAARFKPFRLCLGLSISFLVDLRLFCRLDCLCVYIFSLMALQTKSRIGHLFLRFLYHTQLNALSVGRLWKNGQFVAEGATCITQNKFKRPTSIPSAGFEPAIPTNKRLQTYGLDRTATWIGLCV